MCPNKPGRTPVVRIFIITDRHINAAQELMKLQFPDIDHTSTKQAISSKSKLRSYFANHFYKAHHLARVQINKDSVCL